MVHVRRQVMRHFVDGRALAKISTPRLASLALAAFGWLLVATVGACKDEPKVEQEIARPVKVAVVAEEAPGRTLTYSGAGRPRIESAPCFRLPCQIVEPTLQVGDPGA